MVNTISQYLIEREPCCAYVSPLGDRPDMRDVLDAAETTFFG